MPGIIAPGPKALNFYLRWVSPVTSPPDPTATFSVKMDGNRIFSLAPATAAAYHGNYMLVTVDISAHADGNPHTLRFESHSAASNGATDIDVDDISIVAGTSNDGIFANGFE